MADVRVEVTRVALSTAAATNTTDITISGFGTPKAAIFIYNSAVSDDTITADFSSGIGWTDGTRENVIFGISQDNVATTNTARIQRTDRVISYCDSSGSTETGGFSFDSWITDGVRLYIDNDMPSAYLCTCIFFAGDDISNAYCDTHDNIGVTTDITAPGFEPDLVFISSITSGVTPPVNSTQNILSFGCGINDGLDTQRVILTGSQDAVIRGTVNAYIGNDSIAGQAYANSFSWDAAIGSYDNDGFSLVPSGSVGSDIIFYLCFKFTNSPLLELFDMAWPTTGDYTQTGMISSPAFGFITSIAGPLVRNAMYSAAGVTSSAITAFDSSGIYTTTASDLDSADPTAAKSASNNELKILEDDGSGYSVAASGYALNSDGWTFTLATNPATAVLGWGLSVGPGPHPDIDDVALLMHFNGTDGSTLFTDSSTVRHTFTVVGSAQIDTAFSKWGGASGLFNGAGNYLYVTDNENKSVFEWPDSLAFTFECWVRFNTSSGDQFIVSFGSGYNFELYRDNGVIKVRTNATNRITGTTAVTTGVWYHLAVSRSTGNPVKLYVNGVQEGGTFNWIVNTTVPDDFPKIGARWDGAVGFSGNIDDLRVTKGSDLYPSNFTPPNREFPSAEIDDGVLISAPSPVGVPLAVLEVPALVRASAPSPIGYPSAMLRNDFTARLKGNELYLFTMDLTTPSGPVTVPISSWQGTLQVERQNYVQCVVYDVDRWAAELLAATAFTIYRVVTIDGATIRSAMAAADISATQYYKTATSHNCILRGNWPGYTEDVSPPTEYDRNLTGVRQIQTSPSGLRVRCDMDFMLKPAQRAYVDGVPFIAAYINYYASRNDAYMDVGERS